MIRNAKPAVPAMARETVLGYIEASGAAASIPTPFRILSRVAAMLLLAVGSGVIAAMLAPGREAGADPLPGLAAQRAMLQQRVDSLEQESPAARLALLEQQVAEFEDAQRAAEAQLEDAVVSVITKRDQNRMTEWRERHVEYVRAHNKRTADATIERLRDEVNLTSEQEAEVRALLDEAGKEAEGLIGKFYGRSRHHSANREFEKLAEVTDNKLNALLSEQQRKQVGEGLVSARPEDWGPSSEFRDGTDYEVYMNWMSVSRE
jgi:hypothetical protein